MNVNNTFFEMLEEFKYMGTKLIIRISIQEEIKSILNAGNAFIHSLQNLLSVSFLPKNLKIIIKDYIFLFLFCMGVKFGSSH
jgi:hypothetical protein